MFVDSVIKCLVSFNDILNDFTKRIRIKADFSVIFQMLHCKIYVELKIYNFSLHVTCYNEV